MLADHEPRNGRAAKQYPERETAIVMGIYTRAPRKWLLVDRETGEVYEGNDHGSWDRLIQDPSITDQERDEHVKRIQH